VGTEVLADLLLEGDFFVDAHAASRPRLAGRPTDQPVRFT
jgi:hypothetical protein